MGIRFFCPNGHKLHVKAFQAGKRGICPHCGVSMDIPLKSTRRSSKQLGPSSASSAPPALTSQAIPVTQEPEVVSLSVLGEDGPQRASSAMRSAGGAVASEAVGPTIGHRDQRTVPAAGDLATEASFEAFLDLAGLGGLAAPGVAPSSGTEARLRSSAASPPGGTRMPDPLADPAEVVWYVRPPSGGQFGPANRDLMRAWITEGRVTPDSLVWREGWRDWQEAQSVLPQFTTSEVEPELEDMIAEELFSPRIRTERRTTRKPSRLSLAPWMVLTIVVALALSMVAVVWVWFHMS
jgi:hypothetical protein